MSLPRPSIPLSVQRDAALLQLGLDPKTAELDHDPALGLRPICTVTGDYKPPANDPRYLVWRDRVGHAKKTRGVKATTAGSDVHLIAKGKRLRRAQADGSNRLLAKYGVKLTVTTSPRRKAKIASRVNPWPKGRKIESRKSRRRS